MARGGDLGTPTRMYPSGGTLAEAVGPALVASWFLIDQVDRLPAPTPHEAPGPLVPRLLGGMHGKIRSNFELNGRGASMRGRSTALPTDPKPTSLSALREAARHCRACELYRGATQTVFGLGDTTARIILVGEMPGDEEDREGNPFVGPAGRLLDAALAEAKMDRDQVYLTNIVKHFRWEPRGRRRLHKKPGAGHIAACGPWFDAEMALIQPEVVVCLGATAAQYLLGRSFRVTKMRGQAIAGKNVPWLVATYHPSAVLRTTHAADRDRMRQALVNDLKKARRLADNKKRLQKGESE